MKAPFGVETLVKSFVTELNIHSKHFKTLNNKILKASKTNKIK